MMKCPATGSDFPMFFSPFATGGLMSGNRGSFDDLESMIDEMFSSTLQFFDEAMRSDVVNRQIAEERAMKAFDANLPSFLDEIVSSITSYTSSSASSSSSSGDEPQEEEEEEEEEEVFSSLMGDLMDITRHIQRDSQRRRLSEGKSNDPHMELKDRLARRLTEYVSKTELFLLPGGGTMEVVSVSQVNPTPMLGLGDRDVDECIYSSYKNNDLSSGCTSAVSSYMDFVTARPVESRVQQQQTPIKNSLAAPATEAADETLVQTLAGVHQRFINENDGTTRYLVYGSILSSIVVLISLCALAVKDIWSFFVGVALLVAGIFAGPVFMLTLLAVLIIYDNFYPSDEDDEEEEETLPDDFDYVKMKEEDDDDAAEVNGNMRKPRVFIGVPVQVV